MKKQLDKRHWYDGYIYDIFIAPNQDNAYRLINSIIKDNAVVLDAGCGTGRLAVKLSGKYSKYIGIDPSIRNVEVANKYLKTELSDKISFHHSDVQSYLLENNAHIDYAVLSYVIHEIDKEERVNILKDLSAAADFIIVVDYLYPRPKGFWTLLNEVVEFVAGKEHYRNFKTYLDGKGIRGLAHSAKLKIVKEIKNKPTTSHIAVMVKPDKSE
ncbi:MAG: class I SAM-dependent methyltransferase [Melioribacteraceae bacterium]|nr:class I SAM-dependent methyltransferase [Melioribacteraceae bacterium]